MTEEISSKGGSVSEGKKEELGEKMSWRTWLILILILAVVAETVVFFECL